MVTRTLRAYVELAAGLGEVTRARAVEAAQELVAFAGSDPSPRQVAAQVTRLADDLLKAAEHNRDHVVALVQREVEAALGRVDAGRLLGEVQSLGTSVAGLATQVDEIARAVGLRTGRSAVTSRTDLAEPALASPPALDVSLSAPAAAPAGSPTTRTGADRGTSAGRPSAAKKTGARKTGARTSTTRKSGTTKTAAKKSTAKKTGATKTAAQKSTGKRSTAKKSGATKTAAQRPAAKRSAAKKSAAKRTTATKGTAQGPSTSSTSASSADTGGSGSGA